MKKRKFQPSSDVFAHFETENDGSSLNNGHPEGKERDSLHELNQELAALHAAHKGMHPAIFIVLAALHDIFVV
jgi:hypothetical protein